ncbi:type II toxin-antitoxin system HicA family toxin [bacterium]|nr:type II toxin-antitoxin system HicA family toxin [bacterium]
MPKQPVVSGRELIKALGHIGYEPLRQRGSHVTLVNREVGKTVSVAVHSNKPLPPGTLAHILRQVDISNDELRELVDE